MVKAQLEELCDMSVLVNVEDDNTIEWATQMVIVRKPSGKLRICADFKVTINQYLRPEPYQMPNTENMLNNISNGKVFSKVDLMNAYLQIPGDCSSQQYLTISTSWGYFQYARLPFGIDGICAYMDDLIIVPISENANIPNLKQLFKKFRQVRHAVSRQKCSFNTNQIEYLGFIIKENAIRPNEERPCPTTKQALKSWLGLATYHSRFAPHLQDICQPLHDLTRKEKNLHGPI